MKKQHEIATIKANSATFEGWEIFWILSKNQLEFLFKEIEIFSPPSLFASAKYQEVMLPVINLEKYYGLVEKDVAKLPKYLVVRSVNEKKELVKVIIQTQQTYKIQTLGTGVNSLQSPMLPQNSNDVLGMYFLATGKLGIVPDFAQMSRSIQLRN